MSTTVDGRLQPTRLVYSFCFSRLLYHANHRLAWSNFSWGFKVIRDYFGFSLLCSVIDSENSRCPLNQSNAKVKTIDWLWLPFSRASSSLFVFTLNPHWLVVIFTCVLIGGCDNFGFGFSTPGRKLLNYVIVKTPCSGFQKALSFCWPIKFLFGIWVYWWLPNPCSNQHFAKIFLCFFASVYCFGRDELAFKKN